jgi:hemerythrin superfamily protein
MADMHERMVAVEIKLENVEESLRRFETNLNSNTQATMQIKERLDKQNGAIPHMSEDIKTLMKVLSDHAEQEELDRKTIIDRLQKKSEEEVRNALKIKIMWAVVGFVCSGLGAYILNEILR